MNITQKQFKALKVEGVQSEKELQGLCEEYLQTKRLPYIHLDKYVRCNFCHRWHPVKNDKGFADLDIKTPGGNLLVELKTKKGRLSPAQKYFKAEMERMGYSYFVIRDFDAFKNLIDTVISTRSIPKEIDDKTNA